MTDFRFRHLADHSTKLRQLLVMNCLQTQMLLLLFQKGITFGNGLGHRTVSALWINVIEFVSRTLVPHA